MLRESYIDDLTDREWNFIEKFIDKKRRNIRGRKGIYEKREILNAIFYLLRTGCSWQHLPHDFPKWKSAYSQFWRWRRENFFEKLPREIRKDANYVYGLIQFCKNKILADKK